MTKIQEGDYDAEPKEESKVCYVWSKLFSDFVWGIFTCAWVQVGIKPSPFLFRFKEERNKGSVLYFDSLSIMILAVYFVSSIISQFLSSSLSGVTQQLLIF